MPSPRYAPPKFHQIPVGRSPVKKWITESVDYTAPHSACSESVSRRCRASDSSPRTCRPNFMTIGSLEPEICRFKVDVLVNGVCGHNGNPRLHTYETSLSRQRFRRRQCLSRRSFTSMCRNSGASDVNGCPMRRRAARLTVPYLP